MMVFFQLTLFLVSVDTLLFTSNVRFDSRGLHRMDPHPLQRTVLLGYVLQHRTIFFFADLPGVYRHLRSTIAAVSP